MQPKPTPEKNNKNTNKLEDQDIFIENDPALNPHGSNPSAIEQTASHLKLEKLAYISQMLLELKILSEELEEDMITYLIEMAYMEASTANTVQIFGGEIGSGAYDPSS